MSGGSDFFELYDLDVFVEGDKEGFCCSHELGYAFSVVGENLVFKEGRKFSMYSLSALLPLLPAKQRDTSENDWMTSDQVISCPDPNCSGRFKIKRVSKTKFSHSEVTRVTIGANDDNL